MAYSSLSLEQAMDTLGTSYMDGVSVKIADKYCIKVDLAEVEQVLKKPAPSVLRGDLNYDTSFEKKVLEDLESKRKVKEQHDLDRKVRIEKYEMEKAKELERKQKAEEEKALEDERIRLEEIERERRVKQAEKEMKEEESRKVEKEIFEQKRVDEEAEWKKFEEERFATVKHEETNGNTNEKGAKQEDSDISTNEEFVTPPQEMAEPPFQGGGGEPSYQIEVRGSQTDQQRKDNVKINFSDFEALSDPFGDLELKTINDLEELQTILATNTTLTARQQPSCQAESTVSSQTSYQQAPGCAPSYPQFYPTQHSNYPANRFHPGGLAYPPTQCAPSYPAVTTQAAYHPFTSTSQMYQQPPRPTYPVNYKAAYLPSTSSVSAAAALPSDPHKQPVRSVSSDRRTERLKDGPSDRSGEEGGELKPSRSVGDIIGELQKEQRVMEEHKRKSVGSPIPSGSRGPATPTPVASGLENWVPWPELDAGKIQQTKQASSKVSSEDTSCLTGLSEADAATCRQLHEMGFPLARLAMGCRAVGTVHQTLVNFCVVVDRLVEAGYSVADSEQVASLHNADEEVCMKHLKAFSQLAEIGFPAKDVHEALIAHSFDHQKALEQLIN